MEFLCCGDRIIFKLCKVRPRLSEIAGAEIFHIGDLQVAENQIHIKLAQTDL